MLAKEGEQDRSYIQRSSGTDPIVHLPSPRYSTYIPIGKGGEVGEQEDMTGQDKAGQGKAGRTSAKRHMEKPERDPCLVACYLTFFLSVQYSFHVPASHPHTTYLAVLWLRFCGDDCCCLQDTESGL